MPAIATLDEQVPALPPIPLARVHEHGRLERKPMRPAPTVAVTDLADQQEPLSRRHFVVHSDQYRPTEKIGNRIMRWEKSYTVA